MNCPRCGSVQLLERERDGVRVDGCPDCRGIWLDRGELERIVERARREDEEWQERARRRDRDDDAYDDRRHDRGYDRDREHGYSRDRGKHRKRSWFESLSKIFD